MVTTLIRTTCEMEYLPEFLDRKKALNEPGPIFTDETRPNPVVAVMKVSLPQLQQEVLKEKVIRNLFGSFRVSRTFHAIESPFSACGCRRTFLEDTRAISVIARMPLMTTKAKIIITSVLIDNRSPTSSIVDQ